MKIWDSVYISKISYILNFRSLACLELEIFLFKNVKFAWVYLSWTFSPALTSMQKVEIVKKCLELENWAGLYHNTWWLKLEKFNYTITIFFQFFQCERFVTALPLLHLLWVKTVSKFPKVALGYCFENYDLKQLGHL